MFKLDAFGGGWKKSINSMRVETIELNLQRRNLDAIVYYIFFEKSNIYFIRAYYLFF